MNLSKKSIKHILRILDNKCIEVPPKTSAYNSSGYRILTRDFEPKKVTRNEWLATNRLCTIRRIFLRNL